MQLFFSELRWKIPRSLHEYNFHFLIIMTRLFHSSISNKEMILRIFRLCRTDNIVNVVLLIEEGTNNVTFYSYELYGPNRCNSVKVLQINRYVNGRLEKNFLFPFALQNFHNCSLDFTIKVLPPILSFHGDLDVTKHLPDTSKRLSGIEGDLLHVLAKSLNFSIVVKSRPKEKSILAENFTAKGCYEEVNTYLTCVSAEL